MMNQQALEMNKGPEQGVRRTKRRLVVDMDKDMDRDMDEEKEKDTKKSLSCCRRKKSVKRVSRRRGSRGKGVKRSRRSRSRKSRSRSRKRRSRSRRGRSRRSRRSRRRSRRSRRTGKHGRSRRSRRRSRRSRRRRGRSRKSRSRKSRSKRRCRRSRSKRSKRRRRRRRSKAEIIADNREQLTKSQSLTVPSAKTLPEGKDAAIANLEAPVTPYSPMRKDKRTRPSQDGAILKAAPQPAIERDVRFQPMRSSPHEHPKKEDEAPSTAIDIDSLIKRRRPKPPTYQAATEAAKRREQEMRQREEERFMRPPPVEEPVEPPAFQRVPDMVPIEEGIDPDYPAQRIVISNFVRNGCHIKRWLYEDSYPLDAPRPSLYGLTGKGRQYANCCCGRRGLCYGCAGRGSTSKQRGYIQDNYENDRIRGELQRLEVILKNLDD